MFNKYTIIGVNNFNRVVLIHKLSVLHQTMRCIVHFIIFHSFTWLQFFIMPFFIIVYFLSRVLLTFFFFLTKPWEIISVSTCFPYFFFYTFSYFIYVFLYFFCNFFFCFSIRSCLQTNWNTNMVVFLFVWLLIRYIK